MRLRAVSRKQNISDLGSSSGLLNCEVQKRGVRIGVVAKLELSWEAVRRDSEKP